MKTGLSHFLPAGWHSRFYTEPSYYKALGFNHDNKCDCKTIANFARSEGTFQRPLQNKEVSMCWNCAALEANGDSELERNTQNRRLWPKLSQDPGKGYTFSERRTERLHPPVKGIYRENCLSLWWEKIHNKMSSCNWSVLCNNPNRKIIWKIIDTCVCITESFCCTPETNTTLLINCNPIQIKSLKKDGLLRTTASATRVSSSCGTPSSQKLIYHECSAPLCLIGVTTGFSKGESPKGDFQVFQRLSATTKKKFQDQKTTRPTKKKATTN